MGFISIVLNDRSQLIEKDDFLFAVSEITNAISASSNEYTIYISVIAGAFSAFLFNILFWSFTRRANKKDSLIKRVILLMDNYENDLIEYWVETTGRNDRLEIKIKSNHILLMRTIHAASDFSYKKNNIIRQIEISLENLFDIATGEEFESNTRKKDPEIAKKCSKEISILKSKLFLL